jgi:hypothetical protein
MHPISGKGCSPNFALKVRSANPTMGPCWEIRCGRRDARRCIAINRTQALVLGFFVLAWASLVALFAAAPEVYGRALGLASAGARLLFLVAITAFLALLGMGVIRRWRWAFWLIFVAFLFGPLRVVASVLALGGVLSADGPTWYVLYQALLGLLQFVIALAMLAGYRRAGGIFRCYVCDRSLVTRSIRANSGKFYHHYYSCPSHNRGGNDACTNRKNRRAVDVEGPVWELVSGLLRDPERLRAGLNEMIEAERAGMHGDPEAETLAWWGRLDALDSKRSRYQDMAAEGHITFDELGAKLRGREATRTRSRARHSRGRIREPPATPVSGRGARARQGEPSG